MVAGDGQITGFDSDTEQRDILKLSHGTAVILLFSEFCLLLEPYSESGTLTCFLFFFLSSLRFVPHLPALFPQEPVRRQERSKARDCQVCSAYRTERQGEDQEVL